MSDKEKLEQLKEEALGLMKKAGFPITGTIVVETDPKLPYMGYTTERNGHPLIVVAGFALKENMAINLLIHELSHVYRTQSGHPSHDQGLLLSVAAWIMHGRAVEPYQEKIIHAILNNLQDLYADDISFAIFDKTANLNEFFMGWIHEPVAAKTTEQKWENAEKLLSVAFAQGNLERHKIADTGGKVQKAVDHFLKKIDKNFADKYDFFKTFMVDLPEKVTEKEFEKLLISYLGQFLRLTN